jgi:glycine cleavage system H protein
MTATKPLVFMMGQAPAILPVDRFYARNHMWAAPLGGTYRFGLSAYAVRLLGDLLSLEWSIGPQTRVEPHQPIGSVEGSKAVSELYAPAAGRLVHFNLSVLLDPGLINSNLYDSAWLFELECSGDGLLGPQQYLEHLAACWPITQRMLKGQAAEQGRAGE